MTADRLRIVILGLSITSSWGNGHATTYRGLVRELVRRGHDVTFLERNQDWYAQNRDLPHPPYGRTHLYDSLTSLRTDFAQQVSEADVVIVGSFVPEGAAVGDWVQQRSRGVKAFYDIDTPVTLARLARGEHDYLRPAQIANYDLYLSFTGGPTLERLEREYGSPRARVLYCSVDPELYFPEPQTLDWDLGYMGTYSDDRQPTLNALLLQPAREHAKGRFVVAGPQYPETIAWPANVEYLSHVPPASHRRFYNRQRFTLNVTRADMIAAGWSPSVRLFEAAACGTPIISDCWEGLDSVLKPGREILIATRADDVLTVLREMPESQRLSLAQKARARILAEHTAACRARELESYVLDLMGRRPAALLPSVDAGHRMASEAIE
jgi:spore maturation protein CgeB